MTATEAFTQFMTVVQQEMRDMDALLSLLKEEKALLSQTETPGLIANNDRKQVLLDQIQTRDKQREQILQNAGFDADKTGMQAFLQQGQDVQKNQDRSNAGIDLWTAFHKRIQECAHWNQINHRIVQTRLNDARQIIALLRGQEGSCSQYTPKGQTVDPSLSRPLASA